MKSRRAPSASRRRTASTTRRVTSMVACDGTSRSCSTACGPGLRRASEAARAAGLELVSAGVDSWGVDYGLIDGSGELVEEPICYRDDRTAGLMAEIFSRVGRDEIFARTGIQFLQFNTLFQLAAHARDGLPSQAARLLLIPDLCHHLLTERRARNEPTGRPRSFSTCERPSGTMSSSREWGCGATCCPAWSMPGRISARSRRNFSERSGLHRCESLLPRRTTQRARSSIRRSNRAGRTFHPAPGRWSAWNATRRSSARRSSPPISPTNAAPGGHSAF